MRAYLLLLQYWLAGSDTNIEQMIRYFIDRFAQGPRAALKGAMAPKEPEVYPEVGLWHPALAGRGITEDVRALPGREAIGTVGVLVGRSYLLADNTAHYAAVVRAIEAHGMRAVPAFASALDARPAIDRYFRDGQGKPLIDAMVNLTGFSLVGGPAYNDSNAAQEVLRTLDVPYLTLQTLEFQTIDEWRADPRGLNPLQATLQVAIPELDGAIVPTVYGGKGNSTQGKAAASEPIPERIERVAARLERLVRLRRTPRAAEGRDHPLQLPAQRGQHGQRGLPGRLPVGAAHAGGAQGAGVRRRAAVERRRPARAHHAGEPRTLRRAGERARAVAGR